jgi:ABC-type lipoprotein release transport system permease subunit
MKGDGSGDAERTTRKRRPPQEPLKLFRGWAHRHRPVPEAGISGIVRLLVPGLPVYTSAGYMAAALIVSVTAEILARVIPARRAAVLRPIEALRAE